MEKPFDTKALTDRLKSKGLDIAEEFAIVLVEETLGWVSDSVTMSESKVDDLALAVIPAVKPYIMGQIDRIDGQVG